MLFRIISLRRALPKIFFWKSNLVAIFPSPNHTQTHYEKLYFTLLAVAGAVSFAAAQSLSPQVISSTGGFSNNGGNGSLSYTVGEMTMVQTFSSGNVILTQGFQQPNDFTVGLLDITKDDFGSFVMYPNPAVDNMSYAFTFPESGNVKVAVVNNIGQTMSDVYNSAYTNGKTVETLNVTNYAAGVYFMNLTFTGDKDGKVYTISKKFQVMN